MKVDVTITGQGGTSPPVKKTISVVIGDQLMGRIRTRAIFSQPGADVPLNVDVTPSILPSGRIRLGVNLDYDLTVPPTGQDAQPTTGRTLMRTLIQENLAVNLDDGKPLIVAQSADPISDRQVTIELRATILK